MKKFSNGLRWVVCVLRKPHLAWEVYRAWTRTAKKLRESASPAEWTTTEDNSANGNALNIEDADFLIRPWTRKCSNPCLQHALTLYQISPVGGRLRLSVKREGSAISGHAEFQFEDKTWSLGEQQWKSSDRFWVITKS